jgi:hypothetical protein
MTDSVQFVAGIGLSHAVAGDVLHAQIDTQQEIKQRLAELNWFGPESGFLAMTPWWYLLITMGTSIRPSSVRIARVAETVLHPSAA